MAVSSGNSTTQTPIKTVRSSASDSLLGQFVNLPTAFKSAGKDIASKEAYASKLDGLKLYPINQLQEAAQILAQLNRYTIKPEKRLLLTSAILAQIYAVMARHYQVYQTNLSSLPESLERRQTVLACIEITEQAVIAYKHVFKELYSTKTANYQKQRNRLVEVGVRALELIRLGQRFRALRHQKLPATEWKDINRLFFSFLIHNDLDEKQSLLGSMGTWGKSGKNGHQGVQGSVRSLYVSIQLFAVLDAPSWSTRLFHAPDGYLETLENPVLILADHQQELQPGNLLTGVDHGAPALFQRAARLTEPCVIIEYTNLYNQMIQDYEELAKMKFIGNVDTSQLPRPLLSLEPMERLPFLETMLFGLRPRERRQKRHAVFDNENLRLHFGFRDGFRLLMNLADPNLRRVADTRGFTDASASHTVGNAESDTYNQTKWQIANFSTGGVLIATRETNYTTPIQIGQIVAFNTSQDTKRPLIGYVARIHRSSDQQVEVAIVRLSTLAESAVVVSDAGKQAGQSLGVILFQNMEGRWCLISRHDYDFVPGTPLRLTRENNKTLPARLSNVMLTKQEFVVFELSAPGMS
jgi:hypothetical protein